MPMMVISAVYPGASPDDVNELVTQPIEDAIGTLNGIKGVTSSSSENVSIVLLEYEYGMDMDKAYSDLKKKMDNLTDLPDDVDAPVIMEFNINEAATMTLAVNSATTENPYNYVEQYVSPEFEKLSSVASVDISGGQSEYIRVELIPEKLDQYHLNMSAIASSISAANFSYPAGSAIVGSQDLSVTETPFIWKMWLIFTALWRTPPVSAATTGWIPFPWESKSSRKALPARCPRR